LCAKDDAPSIIVYRWLPEHQLCLIVKIDQAEALAPAHAFGRTLLLIGSLVLLAASVLAIGLARTITRPVLALQAGVTRFGQGEWHVRLPESSRDELGHLAHEFNAMAAALSEKETQLRRYTQELEQMVQERTAALQEIAENMAAAQQIAHFGSWEVRLTGNLEFVEPFLWSDECYHVFGFEPGSVEITSEILLSRLHPDDRESALRAALEGIQDRRGHSHEYRLVLPDGAIRHIHEQAKVVLDERTGQPVKLVGTLHDITERKRAEAEIKRRNRELTLYNEIIAASAAGLEPEAVLGIACRELALAFETPQAQASLLNEQKTTAAVVAEYLSARSSPGQTNARSMLNQTIDVAASAAFQYLLTHKTPLVIADIRHDSRLAGRHFILQRGTISLLILPLLIRGEVVGSLALEGTEPRHFSPEEISLAWSAADQVAGALARVRLAQSQQRLSAALEQTAESVIITDIEGAIIYVNPAFERVSGYSCAEAIGQNPRFLKSGQQDAAFYADLWAAISAGQVWHGRLVNKKKDGTVYTEDATITPVRDESGAIVNYVGVKRDVTRELQLEEQYRQAQKMEAIGRLAGGVAHDFNNLLVVIIGYSELLLDRQLDAASPWRKYVEEIKKAAERAARLTRQLLVFSRQQVLQPEILELNTVVSHIEHMLRRLIGEDIDLITNLEPGLAQVQADAGQIEQIILNLAINARDAMPRGGKLTIQTANVELDETYTRQHVGVEPGPYVMLAVSDTGTGMDAATQARIFEPFFTTKEQGQGTGLGLATVYGIVKQSGGHVWVYSEPGRGTTFKIYLPRVPDTAPALEPEPSPPAMPSGAETVLVVEDEEAVRALARQVLEMHGYTVLEASHGGEALLLCEQRREPIHLLLTDVVMPHMSGQELAERLAAQHPEMKVLYMSGYTDQAIVHHGVLEPDLFYLQKPFSSNALVHKVRQVLDTPRPN
jgi:PAS domain S-box-containing protein